MKIPDGDDAVRPESPGSDRERDLEPVFRTADLSLLLVVKSALEAAGFECVIHGDGPLGPFPLGRFAVGVYRPVLGATILVAGAQADEAKEYLRLLQDDQMREPEAD